MSGDEEKHQTEPKASTISISESTTTTTTTTITTATATATPTAIRLQQQVTTDCEVKEFITITTGAGVVAAQAAVMQHQQIQQQQKQLPGTQLQQPQQQQLEQQLQQRQDIQLQSAATAARGGGVVVVGSGAGEEQQQQQQEQLLNIAASSTEDMRQQAGDNMTGQLSEERGAEEPMATSITMCDADVQELHEIIHLLWGDNIRADVFERWSQGFVFSEVEPSALVQKQGGPCAVIAPVQAYLLKFIIMDMPEQPLKDLSFEKCQRLLIKALCNILKNCRTPRFRMVMLRPRSPKAEQMNIALMPPPPPPPPTSPKASTSSAAVTVHEQLEQKLPTDAAFIAAVSEDSAFVEKAVEATDLVEAEDQEQLEAAAVANTTTTTTTDDANTTKTTATTAIDAAAADAANDESVILTAEQFHERLQTLNFDCIEDVERFYLENLKQLSNNYGVLLFLYSVFLTKGIIEVNADITDTSEPLIHNTFGYGAQALINLMLTGRAVAHVWDNEQDVGGLKLRGISEQSDIGFITLMEQLRYCTVGSFFKNPRYPVWVMGSDTHLTVLFSSEKRLVSPETPSELGRRVFKSYDPEGNNFISTSVLQDVLASLNLVSEPAYVNIMQKRLDPENLGIILLNAFMDEFYPIEKRSTPDTFELMHYNGIPGSNMNNKVRYYRGAAVLLEGDIKNIFTTNPMVTCLQTKWPNIEVNWQETYMPSLN